MNDWSDTPIYAQMMAEKQEREMLEAERIENPIWVQVVEERKQKEKLMNSWQQLVIDMRNAMDLPVAEGPRTLSPAEAELHIKMIRDEFEKEFVPAYLEQDLVEMYDAGIDVIVYVIGAMSNAGFDIDPGFREIMRSNMSKFDPETGKAIKAGPNDPSGEPEGKVLKGPAYSPPNLHPIINDQFLYGWEDKSVYRTKATPITLGVGGPKIGEGDIHMDHNGNLEMDGVLFDLEALPAIEGMSILGSYSEPSDEVEIFPEDSGRTGPVIPEGWPVPEGMLEGVDEAWMEKGPATEMFDAAVQEHWPISAVMDEIDPKQVYDEAFLKLGYIVPSPTDQGVLININEEKEENNK